MSPEKIESFRQFTGADAETARSFLNLCEDNLEMAVGLYMDDPNSCSSNTNVAPVLEEYRSPIPQRTERLIPVDVPIYPSHLEQGPTLRSRRRAFVADDSDDEIQVVGEASFPGSTESSTGLSGLPNGASGVASSSEHVVLDSNEPSNSGPRPNGARSGLPNKRGYLRQLYQPPTELLFDGTLVSAQAAAREKNQWLLVSLHDEGCFDCHLLNRDVWKDPKVYQTIKRNFVFLQIPVDSPEGVQFRAMHSYVQSASHISILNPYTGEQCIVWMHLKDATTVHEALTEFIQHTKLVPPSLTTVTPDPQPGHSRDQLLTTLTGLSSRVGGSRRPQSYLSDNTSESAVKRPRLGLREVDATTALSSRVAAVSSQLTNTTTKHRSVSRVVDSCPDPLDLSEEEQLRLAIEASTVEITPPEKNQSCTRSARRKNGGNDDDALIVLTDEDEDDEEDNRDARSSPDLDSPGRKSDCFIFDPEAYPSTTSTATISCRRPLRPSSMTTVHDTAITATSTARGAVSAEVSQTDHTTLDTSAHLPVPEPNEEVFELAVRMPDGHREVFRLASTLTLQILQRYFALRGFSQTRYELVHLYPHRSLSDLPPQATLATLGLARKDTLFLQER